eukprot:TRINITY_DN48447_c0_g1_i1.p1 TRINITY_DN48447_c0_g1~~TRINITY_DN48447_c0_g1_i1.p1  ORF type:complete len:939 (-),score=171.85 TRINITY_DN48447_c0_g1_i1:131-2947(-)
MWKKLVGNSDRRVIPDESITASSYYGDQSEYGKDAMWRSRMDCDDVPWCAAASNSDQWIQWDLGEEKLVAMVFTKGRNDWSEQYVKTFYLSYSGDGIVWEKHPKEMVGNDGCSPTGGDQVDPPIVARFVRLHPISWNNHIALSAELHGDDPPVAPLVGTRAAKVIPDSAITASSCFADRGDHGLGQMWRSRFDNTDTTWCAGTCDEHQWIQWDFGSRRLVLHVATKGRHNQPQWVSRYNLLYSEDGHTWTEAHSRYFVGNVDEDSVVKHRLTPPIHARYIRLIPLEWHGHIALRAEFLGRECAPSVNEQKASNLALKLFEQYDADGNGQIGMEELLSVFGDMGKAFDKEHVATIFETIDTSGDGKIDAQEFVNWVFGAEAPQIAGEGDECVAMAKDAVLSGDLKALQAALIRWRQCLPVEDSARICDTLAELIEEVGKLLESRAGLGDWFSMCTLGMGTGLEKDAKKNLAECFRLLDTNRDGKVDLKEGMEMVKAQLANHGGASDEKAQQVWADDIHKGVDYADQTDDLEEFLDMWAGNFMGAEPSKQKIMGDFMINSLKAYVAIAACNVVQAMVDILFEVQRVMNKAGSESSATAKRSYQDSVNKVMDEMIQLSFCAGAKRAKYALLQAQMLGVNSVAYRNALKMTKVRPDEADSLNLPSYWNMEAMQKVEAAAGFGLDLDEDDKSNLVARVELSSSELQVFQQLFDASFRKIYTRDRQGGQVPDRLEVVRGQRIQNLHNWVEFQNMKRLIALELNSMNEKGQPVNTGGELKTDGHLNDLQMPLDAEANCRWFFHGTNSTAAQLITAGDFLIKLAGSNAGTLYGKGVYLAESCSKSDEYCQEDEEGLRHMLVCRAALGNVLYNAEVKPDTDKLVDAVLNGPYQSLVGDREKCRGTFKEILVYYDNQVYPEFIIQYRRIGGSGGDGVFHREKESFDSK